MPLARPIFGGTPTRGSLGRAADGNRARPLLHWLLLGADGAIVRLWGDEFALGCGARGPGAGGKALTIRRASGALGRYRHDGPCAAEVIKEKVMIEWYVKGKELANCNCSYGCPCQFNALPTYGNCCAAVGFEFESGQFAEVKLDGLRAAALYSWPGPVHKGNGTMQLVIEEKASAKQREALLKIMMGEETKDMATMWWVFSAMSPNKLKPLSKPIDFTVDVDARRGRLSIPGVIETTGEPIRNPVTGAEHRARIDLPNGFEYELAEIGSGTTRAMGELKLDLKDSYFQFARIHLSHQGVVRKASAPAQAQTVM